MILNEILCCGLKCEHVCSTTNVAQLLGNCCVTAAASSEMRDLSQFNLDMYMHTKHPLSRTLQ